MCELEAGWESWVRLKCGHLSPSFARTGMLCVHQSQPETPAGGWEVCMRQCLVHSKGPIKVRWMPSWPQYLVISGATESATVYQESSHWMKHAAFWGSLRGNQGLSSSVVCRIIRHFDRSLPPGMDAFVPFSPFQCGLNLLTHFWWTEYGRSDGVTVPRLGYKKIIACILDVLSCAPSFLEPSCWRKYAAILCIALWRDPHGRELMNLVNSQWAPEACQQPHEWD